MDEQTDERTAEQTYRWTNNEESPEVGTNEGVDEWVNARIDFPTAKGNYGMMGTMMKDVSDAVLYISQVVSI